MITKATKGGQEAMADAWHVMDCAAYEDISSISRLARQLLLVAQGAALGPEGSPR